jgi:PAS domain S-box-containing protein
MSSFLNLELVIDPDPTIVNSETGLLEVIKIMAEKTASVIITNNHKILGVFTAEQVLSLMKKDLWELTTIKIGDCLSNDFKIIDKIEPITSEHLAALMTTNSYIVVVDDYQILGIINPQKVIKLLSIKETIIINGNQEIDNIESQFQERTAALKESNQQLITEIVERKQIENALRHSEERYRLMTENSTDIISRHDLQGVFLYVSPACRQILGYEPEEMLNKSIYDFFHPDDLLSFKKPISSILNSSKTYRLVYRMRSKEGDYIWLETTSKILNYSAHIINNHQETSELICVSRDITERKKAEEELQQAKEQLAVLLDAVPGTVSWIGEDLRYIGVNKQLAAIFRREPEEFVGKELGFLEQKSHFADLMQEFFSRPEQELEIELSTPTADSYLIVAQKYNQNRAAFTVGIEITERKRAEEQLRTTTSRLTALIKNLQAGILVKDESTRVELINQQFCQMFDLNYKPEELIGSSFIGLPQDCQHLFINPEQLAQRTEEILSIRQVVTNEEVYLVDGRTYERDYIPIFVDDEYSGHLWMYRDITERKLAERQLLKTQTDLEQALVKEKELSDLKSRFVTTTSHEFRTPLSTILSSAELLEYYGHKWTLEKQNKHLHRIQSSVKHMTELLNDVLIIGRAEADKLEINPIQIDLNMFCQELIEEMQFSDQGEQSIIFTRECINPIVLIDEKILRQILTNLISNALKYSPSHGVVRFNLICDQEYITFVVEDEGIGIPEEDKRRLFQSFHRATNVRNIPGTGLGLAIVKKCVESYGGTITVESQLEVGTTFTVKLPAYR